MTKQQIIVAAGAIVLIAILFSLPRVVVENETEAELESHDFTITDQDSESIASLRDSLSSNYSDNYIIFADSLARLYLKYGFTDSAYSVVNRHLLGDSSMKALEVKAPLLYMMYERANTPEQAAKIGVQATASLQELLDERPDDLSVKTKLAMTMVTTERPMAGIQMLREVLEQDPTYREAIINLGLLSIRSGQFVRGVDRFQDALNLDSADYEAQLFLGVCYLELGKTDSAGIWFENIKVAENVDPAIRAAAIEYLEN